PRNAPAFRLASPAPMPPVEAPSAPSISAETRAAGIRAYGSLVWRRIAERKPKGIHLPGTAYVNFALTGEGAIAAIRIARSSGNPELDAMALRTIESAAPFDPPPSGLAPQDLVFEIPFNFR
ncbi:energy transducer TonB, partial [Parvibaculum sp.]|uniref:energy transducer TonB family protein n=1 Tax=Parvibaculum sp. TaxID=2024848 RepID=UPI002C49D3AC